MLVVRDKIGKSLVAAVFVSIAGAHQFLIKLYIVN